MICLLTNVAKTQDVPLDGTIFSGNTGHKDRAAFMKKKYSYTVILSFLDLISKKARLKAPASAFLPFIKSWHDVNKKVSK